MLTDVEFDIVYSSGEELEPIHFFFDALLESSDFRLGLGYFSSSAIRALAPGFAYFIANGGKMQMVINNELNQKDKEAIEKGQSVDLERLEDKLLMNIKQLSQVLSKEDEHFFNCFSYLIATKRIEIVATISTKGGIAHDKYGIFSDRFGNKVGFSGSANFSMNALCYNAESISCFTSWSDNSDRKRIDRYNNMFEEIWNNHSEHVIHIPISKVKSYIQEEFPTKTISRLVIDSLSLRSYGWINNIQLSKSIIDKIEKIEFEPRFPYPEERNIQIDAYNAWESNNYQGIFAMATGSGKTITALNCIFKEYLKTGYYKAIIVVPTQTLAVQWEKEARNFNFQSVVSTFSNKDWQSELSSYITRSIWSDAENQIIITTYATFNKPKFQSILKDLPHIESFIYIADEAHNIGSNTCLKNLPYIIHKRIGLSATPERIYDELGSKKMYDFFNSNPPEYCFRFTMKQAIDERILCEYEYYPLIVQLENDEVESYKEITAQLMQFLDTKTGSYKEGADKLLMRRKQIIHKARNKKILLIDLLNEIDTKNHSLNYTFVFVPEGFEPNYSDKDQYNIEVEDLHLIDEYADIFKKKAYSYYKYIGGIPNPEEVLKRFTRGQIDVLLSMKCLDEGVDIPRAETAIFCASTGNPRQFIQRRGRVLRMSKNKEFAKIYDMIVIPPIQDSNTDHKTIERNIFANEIKRVVNFMALAKNKTDILRGDIPSLCFDLEIDLFEMLEIEEQNY